MRFKPQFSLKVYLIIFLSLTIFAIVFRPVPKNDFKPSEVLGANSQLVAFVEPDDGRGPLLTLFSTSQTENLVTVYLLSDEKIIQSLVANQNRGLSTAVLLEQNPFGGNGLNQKTKPILETGGVRVGWANSFFPLTHQKTIIFDQKLVCILNMNLSKAAFESNREYNVCSQNPDDVAEAREIFLADQKRSGYTAKAPNLVVSPDNARGKIMALISSAIRSLDIEMEVITDQKIIQLLTEKSQTLLIRIIVPDFKKVEANKNLPLPLRTLSKPYVHAKLILVDQQRAYVGSVNLTTQSLDQNREMGILVSQPDIISRFVKTFETDWTKAVPVNITLTHPSTR